VRGRCHSEPLPLLQPDRISKFAPMPTQFRVFIAQLAHQIPQLGRVVNNSTRPTPPTALDTVERRGA
jgi:hypothetical protein